jgi:hypothetical protein
MSRKNYNTGRRVQVWVDPTTKALIKAETERTGETQEELLARFAQKLLVQTPAERKAFLLRRAAGELERGNEAESDRLTALALSPTE